MFTIMAKHNFFLPFIAYKMNLRRHEHDIVNRLFYEAGMDHLCSFSPWYRMLSQSRRFQTFVITL